MSAPRLLTTSDDKTNYVLNVGILSAGFFGIYLAYSTTQVSRACVLPSPPRACVS